MQKYKQKDKTRPNRQEGKQTRMEQNKTSSTRTKWTETEPKMATTHNRYKVKQPVRVVEPKHNGLCCGRSKYRRQANL